MHWTYDVFQFMTLVSNISCSNTYLESCVEITSESTCSLWCEVPVIFGYTLMEIEICGQCFIQLPNIKFHKNLPVDSLLPIDRQT